jgi:flagellar hook-basal body complex protein FliE
MIQAVTGTLPDFSTQSAQTAEKNTGNGGSFGQYLSDALNQVNTSILESQRLGEQLATGNVSDIHTVMIAAQKAALELQLAVQIRNKAVEAYQEIMRMQI